LEAIKIKRKTLIVSIVLVSVLASSLMVVSQASFGKLPASYVDYTFRLTMNPNATGGRVITSMDSSRYPIVVIEGYYTNASIVTANVTINDETYVYPDDFDYNYTFHFELNNATGFGLMLVQETLYFKNMPGNPTLNGLSEEKATGYMAPFTNFEFNGDFQVTGTGMFRWVKGEGIGAFGASTGFVVYHCAQICGWPIMR
jgi:hypothetical protein